MRIPFWKFVIQNQTWTATTAGIDQASTRPVVSSTRTQPDTLTSRSAMSVPSTIVRPTFATVNTTVRSRTSQNTSSRSTDA